MARTKEGKDKTKLGMKMISTLDAIPFTGGVVTVRPRGLLNAGSFSGMQNLRPQHPGFETRLGMSKFCSASDDMQEVVSLFQFSKGKRVERYFLAQYADGDVRAASADPPATITGGFGPVVYSGTASPRAAAWSVTDDILIMSNGVDQHQLFAGDENYVKGFVLYKGSSAPPLLPEEGFDYTQEVSDGSSSTVAILDSLPNYGGNACAFICTPIPANRMKYTIVKPNGNAATATMLYRKSNSTWATTSAVDGTSSGGASMAQTGAFTWAFPTDEIPTFMYGRSGFWYQLRFNATLDGEVEVSSVEYGTTGAGASGDMFTPLVNVWDGYSPYAIEARMYDDSATAYFTYSTDNIEIDNMTTSDKLYFNTADKIKAFYVDPGDTPNTAGGMSINAVYYWDGDSWTACTNVVDGTNGLANAGWVTFDWVEAQMKTQFQSAKYYSYWYYFTVTGGTVSSDVLIGIEVMPVFDIGEAGVVGHSSIAWKDRAVYSFGNQYIYISAEREPMVLNGDDFAILQAGDGRANKVVCMRNFHNEIMVWQEEKGVHGGCLTLFEGYNPATFGKLVLSTRVGTFNNKSAVVVDGVLTSTTTDETLKTMAFFLSHYGVCVSDGRTVSIISDDIQDYFDPTNSNCIRRGYEDKMWLDYDSAAGGIRVGLVTGSSATVPNTFLFFDLVDKTWCFDVLAYNLSCHTEIEGASGDVDRLQYGGSTNNGMVYKLNSSSSDDGTAIDAYATMEFNYKGRFIEVRNMYLQIKANSGNLRITPYRNGRSGTQIELSQAARVSGDEIKRFPSFGLGLQDAYCSLKFQCNSTGDSMFLQRIGVEAYVKEDH